MEKLLQERGCVCEVAGGPGAPSVLVSQTDSLCLASPAERRRGARADARVGPPGWSVAWLVPAQVREKLVRCEPASAPSPALSPLSLCGQLRMS